MKFATLFLTLAVFLTSIDLGYSRTPDPERVGRPSASRGPSPFAPGRGPQRPERPERPERTQIPNRQALPLPPYRVGYDAVIQNTNLNIPPGLLAKTRAGVLRRIDHTYRYVADEEGFVIGVLDSTNFLSSLYFPTRIPGTEIKVKIHRDYPRQAIPLTPEEIADFPSEEFAPRAMLDLRGRRNNH